MPSPISYQDVLTAVIAWLQLLHIDAFIAGILIVTIAFYVLGKFIGSRD